MILLAVVNTFLPAVVLAVIALVGMRVLRVNAATRYWAWWAVLVGAVALPFWPQAAPDRVRSRVELPPVPAVNVAPVEIAPATDWLVLAAIAWAGFAVFRLARVAYGYVRLRGIVHRAELVRCTRFEALRVGTGIQRPAGLLVSREVASPVMIGFLRPSVVLPEGWKERLDPAELEHVLLHELAHVARWDDWANLTARVASAFVGLHPVAAFALRRIARERELACDDWVVASTGEARRYAASLAKVFEMSRKQPELLATGIAGSQLGDRVEQILAQGRQFAKGASVMTVATMIIALAGMTAIGSQSPVLVAFAQEVLPAAPVSPAPPKPAAAPQSPSPARAPKPQVAPAPSRPVVRARPMSEALRELRRELAAEQAELKRVKRQLSEEARLRFEQEKLSTQLQSLRKELERSRAELEKARSQRGK